MMQKIKNIIGLLVMFVSCSQQINGTFNSEELVSSKGEHIYINSLNWGATDDYQMTVITANKARLKDRNDTIGTVTGLEPFIYKFDNDTLKLFFYNEVFYEATEHFKTITVQYIALDPNTYNDIRKIAYRNDGYHSVPARKKVEYPADMPKLPSTK